ncbi:MAG: tetratricopeptide repeat protein [Streptosporangiales bacterium]|nr:tetratricopeptide repeat protein [Streptosporangiales bacterium]
MRRELRRRLKGRLEEATTAHPVAHALVLAAADWRDAGCGMPVPLPRLRAQAARRLERVRPNGLLSGDEVEDGLAWATSEPALLVQEQTGDGLRGYRLSPELWPRLTDQHLYELPAEAVLALATPLEAVGVGVRAMFLQDAPDREFATRAWSDAVHSDDEDATALALWYLADLAREDGQASAARDAFAQVIESDHFDAAPRAMLVLAEMELDGGDHAAARTLLRDVVASGHPCVVAQAAGLLASVCLQDDDTAGAVEALRLAVDADDALYSPYCALLLGRLLMRDDDLDGAHRMFQQVIDSGHPVYGVEAFVDLGMLLARRDDVEAAKRTLGQAIDHDDPLAAPELLLALAEVHVLAEELGEAEELLQRLRTYPLGLSPRNAAQMDFLSARIAIGRGDHDEANRLFAGLFDAEDADRRAWATELALALAGHLRRAGVCTVPGSEPLLRFLMGSEVGELAAWAAYGLGRLAHRQDRLDEARDAYRRAAQLDEPTYGLSVSLRLAEILVAEGKAGRALEAYLAIAEAEPTKVTAEVVLAAGRLAASLVVGRDQALRRLREMCWRHIRAWGPYTAHVAYALGRVELDVLGNPYGAAVLLDVALGVDQQDLLPFLWHHLGLAYAQQHAPFSASEAFQRAMDTEHPTVAPLAALALGCLAERQHDLPAASAAYRRALAGEHPRAWAEAAYALGRLMHCCQPDDAEAAYHAVIDSADDDVPEASAPAVVGAAFAHLGRLYAEQGNRTLAERVWRRGRRHPNPEVAASFVAERKSIGPVRRPPKGEVRR